MKNQISTFTRKDQGTNYSHMRTAKDRIINLKKKEITRQVINRDYRKDCEAGKRGGVGTNDVPIPRSRMDWANSVVCKFRPSRIRNFGIIPDPDPGTKNTL